MWLRDCFKISFDFISIFIILFVISQVGRATVQGQNPDGTAAAAVATATAAEPRQSQTMQFFEMCAALIGALAR